MVCWLWGSCYSLRSVDWSAIIANDPQKEQQAMQRSCRTLSVSVTLEHVCQGGPDIGCRYQGPQILPERDVQVTVWLTVLSVVWYHWAWSEKGNGDCVSEFFSRSATPICESYLCGNKCFMFCSGSSKEDHQWKKRTWLFLSGNDACWLLGGRSDFQSLT